MRELFDAIHEYEGNRLYQDCLEPWLETNKAELKLWLDKLRGIHNIPSASRDDLLDLYALSRINETLPVRFQKEDELAWPHITILEYEAFFSALGIEKVSSENFSPFYHEVVSVTETSDNSVEVTSIVWPCLMLGNMLFSRGGVRVNAPAHLMNKALAENSTMYWAYRRENRPEADMSHGWGRNSQWSTTFRRDYLCNEKYCLNVDAKQNIFDLDFEGKVLSIKEYAEIVLNRCAITCIKDTNDLYPYDYKFCIPISSDDSNSERETLTNKICEWIQNIFKF